MAGENSQLIRNWFDQVWNQGRSDVIDQMSHASTKGYGQIEDGKPIDINEFKKLWSSLRSAFPDIEFTIHETIEQDNRVAARWTATMTHNGEFLGIPPSGRRATITGISFQRWENRKVIEGWDNWDQLGLLVQIGAVPAMKFL